MTRDSHLRIATPSTTATGVFGKFETQQRGALHFHFIIHEEFLSYPSKQYKKGGTHQRCKLEASSIMHYELLEAIRHVQGGCALTEQPPEKRMHMHIELPNQKINLKTVWVALEHSSIFEPTSLLLTHPRHGVFGETPEGLKIAEKVVNLRAVHLRDWT